MMEEFSSGTFRSTRQKVCWLSKSAINFSLYTALDDRDGILQERVDSAVTRQITTIVRADSDLRPSQLSRGLASYGGTHE